MRWPKDYEWLRESYPLVDKKDKPIRYMQSWVLEKADLVSAPFDLWIKPSHGPVHMNSKSVAAGSRHEGPAPAGYHPTKSALVMWQCACSLYELVANVCLMMADTMKPGVALAWTQVFKLLVDDLNPGVLSPLAWD